MRRATRQLLTLASFAAMIVARPLTAQDWLRDVRVEQLENGLTVLLAPDARVPHASVELWLPTGTREDPPGRRGLSHLFEHVMAGAPLAVDTAGVRMARPRFADSNAQVRLDYARYFVLTDPGAIDATLAMNAARLRIDQAYITDSVLAINRQIVLNELRNGQTGATQTTAPLARVFATDHPYALPPESEGSLAAVDASMLRAFLRARTAPAGALLVIVGRFDPARVAQRVRVHFAALPAGTPPAAVRVRVAPSPARLERHVLSAAGDAPRYARRFALPPLGDVALEEAELVLRWAAARVARDAGGDVAWSVERTPGALGSTLTLSASLPQRGDVRRLADTVDAFLLRVANGTAGAGGVAQARSAAERALWAGTDRMGFIDSRAEQLAEGLVLAGDARWIATRLRQYREAQPAALARVAAEWLAGRGVEVLVPAAPPRAVQAAQGPAPIALTPSPAVAMDATADATVDTTVLGLRVVLAPLRHVPMIRASLVQGTAVESDTLAPDAFGRWLAARPPRPRRSTVLMLTGNCARADVLPRVASVVAAWPMGDAAPLQPMPPLTPGDSTHSEPGRAQVRLVAEWMVTVQEAQQQVAAELAARQLWQALNLELRTRRGWSYGASFTVDGRAGTAVIRVAAEVQPDKAVDAAAVLRETVARFADGHLAVPAIETLRETLLQAALRDGSTLTGRERQLRADISAGRTARFRDACLAAVSALGPTDIAAARAMLAPPQLRLTIVGDPAVLAKFR